MSQSALTVHWQLLAPTLGVAVQLAGTLLQSVARSQQVSTVLQAALPAATRSVSVQLVPTKVPGML